MLPLPAYRQELVPEDPLAKVVDFVESQRQKGVPDHQVRSGLETAGWEAEAMKRLWARVQQKRQEAAQATQSAVERWMALDGTQESDDLGWAFKCQAMDGVCKGLAQDFGPSAAVELGKVRESGAPAVREAAKRMYWAVRIAARLPPKTAEEHADDLASKGADRATIERKLKALGYATEGGLKAGDDSENGTKPSGGYGDGDGEGDWELATSGAPVLSHGAESGSSEPGAVPEFSWRREEFTAQEAERFVEHAAAKLYQVTSLSERGDTHTIFVAEVRGDQLEAYLNRWFEGAAVGDRLLSVEACPGTGL